ncbi:MAG: aldose 1-epimerase family protein [Clostridiaceae bacterium]|nr:aldose 1-epimerase family protein [Clostridiaceae bacterium]
MTVKFSNISGEELYSWTGSTDQYFSIRRLILADGPAAGMNLIEVITAGGIRALINESRALDIYELHYRGVNLGFQSKNGLAGPVSNWVTPGEFARTWPAGFLATCGLRNTGPDTEAADGYHPLHGRIGQTAAERVGITVDEDKMQLIITGYIRESALFGHHLVMERTIAFDLKGAKISYSDKIINHAAEAEPVFLLYHINFGFPFLSPALECNYPEGDVLPRTDEAAVNLAEHTKIIAPVDGKPEQVFFHMPVGVDVSVDAALPLDRYPQAGSASDEAQVKLLNRELGIAAAMSWKWSELPVLSQWKSMKAGDYALGIEPGNTLIRGRKTELELDSVPLVAGHSSITKGFVLDCETLVE